MHTYFFVTKGKHKVKSCEADVTKINLLTMYMLVSPWLIF